MYPKPRSTTELQWIHSALRYVDDNYPIQFRFKELGHPAHTVQVNGERTIHVLKKNIYVSHIVWYLHKGAWPTKWLGHKDGNKANNRIDNLVEVPHK